MHNCITATAETPQIRLLPVLKKDHLFFISAWFSLSLGTLFFLSFLLFTVSKTYPVIHSSHTIKLYAALPNRENTVTESIEYADSRAKLIEEFFRDYNSVLSNYSNTFIMVADRYHLDWRLLPAIAMQESNGGRQTIQGSFNPFGFGIYGDHVIRFSSWEEGIETVGRTLRESYLNEGLTTPKQIMVKYTPPSVAKGGPWAKGVEYFMDQLR